MGKFSDYKKLNELVAWDLDPGSRGIVNQSKKTRRKLKRKLKKQERRRIMGYTNKEENSEQSTCNY